MRELNVVLWENLVIVLALVLESRSPITEVYGFFVPWSFRSKNKESSSLGLKNESIKHILVRSEITSCNRNEMTMERNNRIPLQNAG